MRAKRGKGVGMASKVTRLLLCSLAGLAAAMGVGIAESQQTPPVVRVESGQLQGVVADGVESFKGIPFAAPPVGDLRWRPPEPAARWTGVRQAAEFGADCTQRRFGPPPTGGASAPAAPAPSEDCLFLNVWRPANATPGAKLPVMVSIHGGGFVFGSSAFPMTSGVRFANTVVAALIWMFQIIDGLLGPMFARWLGRDIPGLGLVTMLLGLLVVGVITTNVFGRRLLETAERYLVRIPVFRTVYSPVKQLVAAFSPDNEAGFNRVVMVDDPRRGLVLGFQTREFTLDRGQGLERVMAVYVPTNHLYLGDVLVFPLCEVRYPDLTVEEGIRVFLTGGLALDRHAFFRPGVRGRILGRNHPFAGVATADRAARRERHRPGASGGRGKEPGSGGELRR